jgi:hypothetical protein
VPVDVMASMTRVPAAYLKQLAEEREIFNELPPAVKQQVGHLTHIGLQLLCQHMHAVTYEACNLSSQRASKRSSSFY